MPQGRTAVKGPQIVLRQLRDPQGEAMYLTVQTVNTLSPKIDQTLAEDDVTRLIEDGYKVTVTPSKM